MLYKITGDETPHELDEMYMNIYYDYMDCGIVSVIEKQKEDYGNKN